MTAIESYYEQYWEGAYADPLSGPRLALLQEWLAASDCAAGRLLEIGSGEGHLAAELLKNGTDVIATDISGAAVKRARRLHPELDMRQMSVEEAWPFGPSQFDVAVSFEVIEHLFEPRVLLEKCATVVRPGGYLALSTPYHGTIKNVLLAVRGFDRHFDVEGQHIRFFSDGAIRGLLADTGWDVEELAHLGRRAPVWANSVVWARRRSSATSS